MPADLQGQKAGQPLPRDGGPCRGQEGGLVGGHGGRGGLGHGGCVRWGYTDVRPCQAVRFGCVWFTARQLGEAVFKILNNDIDKNGRIRPSEQPCLR